MLGVGNIFPSFDLPSCDEDNSLGTTKFNDESCKDHWYVFYFYPKDFTFICPTEIKEMDKLVDAMATAKDNLMTLNDEYGEGDEPELLNESYGGTDPD